MKLKKVWFGTKDRTGLFLLFDELQGHWWFRWLAAIQHISSRVRWM